MHQTSFDLMLNLVIKYTQQNADVLDFGGADVNGSYKQIFEYRGCSYKTVDYENADYIVKDYDWKTVPKNNFDIIISGQTFEHDSFFWLTLENFKTALKPNGTVIIIVPTKGHFHQHPVDCYRFYPDAAGVFAKILNATILEVVWNNSLAVHALKTQTNKDITFSYGTDTEWGDLGIALKLK